MPDILPEPESTVQPQSETQPLVKPVEQSSGSSMIASLKIAFIVVGILTAGVASGWGISLTTKRETDQTTPSGLKSPESVAQTGVNVNDVIGVPDEKTFRDSAEGVLVSGGVNGEGSYHLLRPGGPSQNVYLTSSIVDLDLFVNHKVKVWGETFSAQKAGWLMDVGRVQVMELNSEPPFEEK